MGGGAPDFFYREAQRLGYVARSALKVACQALGPLKSGGAIVGVDLKKVQVPSSHCDKRVRTICADVMKFSKIEARELSPKGEGFSVILSDMCPPISGIITKDAALSMELGMRALALAVGIRDLQEIVSPDMHKASIEEAGVLQSGGNLVIKILENEDSSDLVQMSRIYFKKASLLRPKATRSASREIFLICQSLKQV